MYKTMESKASGSMAAWNAHTIVEGYRERSYLSPAELACLGEIWTATKGGAVLDIGVGTGRTVPFLVPLAGRYVGVDAAPEMVRACRRRYPDVDVREADARELADFRADSFDLVVFSFNGIDYMLPDDRPRALSAILRVLRPGGAFIFSTHNLNAMDPATLGQLVLPKVTWTRHPVRLARRLAGATVSGVRTWRNHRRLAPQQLLEEDYAFVNDGAYNGSMLTCYIRPSAQIEALRAAGFTVTPRLFGLDGRPTTEETRDSTVYYLTWKEPQLAGT